MAKANAKGTKDNPIINGSVRDYSIFKAILTDGFINYDFKVTQGRNSGDKVHIDGSGIYREGVKDAFQAFNVHLAIIDEHFEGLDIEDPTRLQSTEYANYDVHGIVIGEKGDVENISLIGTKYTPLGVMNIQTPKIVLDMMGMYKWYNELKVALANARHEISLYREGNFDTPVKKESKKKVKQMSIGETDPNEGTGNDDDDFDKPND